MPEQSFTPEDSLRLIQDMIDRTKHDLVHDSFYILLWGWLVLIASLTQFVMLEWLHSPYSYQAWQLMWVGVLVTIIRTFRGGRRFRVRTFVGDSMRGLGLGIFFSFLVLTLVFTVIGWEQVINMIFPLYIMLYGLAAFITGNLIRFRPLIIGGIISWVLAIVAAKLSYDHQILVGSAAILSSYIIPGYMLRSRQKRRDKPASQP